MMSENAGQGKAVNEEQKPEEDKSPTEKLEKKSQPGSVTPGTQKPESEVQNERGMNTE
jgi:hypothetical protein